jgi:hypothetical protein
MLRFIKQSSEPLEQSLSRQLLFLRLDPNINPFQNSAIGAFFAELSSRSISALIRAMFCPDSMTEV